ncbi:hypothetical protein ACPA29_28275 [Bacillus bombysepticus]
MAKTIKLYMYESNRLVCVNGACLVSIACAPGLKEEFTNTGIK